MDTGSPKQPHPLQYKLPDQQALGPPPGSYVDYSAPQYDVYDNQGAPVPPSANSSQQLQPLGPGSGPGPGHPNGLHRGPLSTGAISRKPSPAASGLILREDGVAVSSNGVPLDASTLYGAMPPGAAPPSHHGHPHHRPMESPAALMMAGSPVPPGAAGLNGLAQGTVITSPSVASLRRRGTKRKIGHAGLSQPPAPEGLAAGQGDGVESRNVAEEEEPEAELRRAAVHSLQYPLERCAQHVHEDEEGPMADKSRQVFGMTWLLRSCEAQSDGNVPRNRIYARYVTICAELSLQPLNPASFGKLVRIVFPNIKTRRLGVRGQSKYHYCGVILLGDIGTPTDSTPNTSIVTRTPSPDTTPGPPRGPSSTPLSNQSFGDYTRQLYEFNQPSNGSVAAGGAAGSGSNGPSNVASVLSSGVAGITGNAGSAASSSDHNNVFAPNNKLKPSSASFEEVKVPRLANYLSPDVDPDSAATLQALYTSHCRTLLDQLRYMHMKKFFSVINSFIRGLTAPVQRVLKQPDAIRWMADTDRRLYREMLLLLAPLVLQSLPTEVSQGLHALAASLPSQIDNLGMHMGDEFVAAKKEAAAPFVDLIDRLLRANDAAQNAARILLNGNEVAKMKQDWAAYVTPVAAREAPCAQNAVRQILLHEIPTLLVEVKAENANRLTISDALDPWIQYLAGLPKRVVNPLPPPVFRTVCSAVATAALRDLNRGGCSSFGAWWVLRCWVDEFMAWQLEVDAFLQPENPTSGSESFSEHS